MMTLTADDQNDMRAGNQPSACARQCGIRTDGGLPDSPCAARTHPSGHNHVVRHMNTTMAANTAKDRSVQLDNSKDTTQLPGVMVVHPILEPAHTRKTTADAARTTEHSSTSAVQLCQRNKTGSYASR